MNKLLDFILYKIGKNYHVDKNIEYSLIVNVLFTRLIMMLRGFFIVQKVIYLGKSVKIKNKRNIMFGKHITLESYSNVDAYSKDKIKIGDFFKLGAYSIISCTNHLGLVGKGLSIGNNSGIGEFSYFGCVGGVEIGDNVIMGQYISFHSQEHNFTDINKEIKDQGVQSKGIKLGNNIWVGAKVTFLDGANIGDNCIVAAGAVVKGEFPENSIIGGVPAKMIRTRA
tara:strand:- start:2635 stop:3309 length:675 start_codon:yes stop_codon:yes gene_type:complete